MHASGSSGILERMKLTTLLVAFFLSLPALADTPPVKDGFQIKYGTESGLLDLSNGSPSALNCGSNTGYVPTWSGSTFSCAALPASGVTSVGATAPIQSSGGATPIISCIAATGSVAGCLSAADWTTFNGKQAALGFTAVPNTRTISTTAPLSGGGDLSADRTLSCIVASSSAAGCLSSTDWSTFNGKQSSLTFSAPLVNTTGTVSCNAASGSVTGCLSSTDWNTFNGKQDALSFTGTGNTVRATNATLVTPALGTPSALVGTNITGTGASFTAGLATALASNPTDCSANNFANAIDASGNLTCGQVPYSAVTGTPTFTSLWQTVATTLGDLIYGGSSGAPTRLAGDTSNTRKFLREVSSGGVAAAPVWDTLVSGDIPSLSSIYCALAGCTMVGDYINSTAGALSAPSMLVSGAPVTGGSTTTTKPLVLIEASGAASTTWDVNGSMVGVNAPSGHTGTLIDAKVNGTRSFVVMPLGFGGGAGFTDQSLITSNIQLVLKGASTNTQISLYNPVSAVNFNLGINNTISYLGAGGLVWFRFDNTTTGMVLGYNQTGSYFPLTHSRSSTATDTTTVVIASSSVIPPASVNQNNSATAGNFGLWGNAGAGSNHVLNAYLAQYTDVHTNGSEESHQEFWNSKAGTRFKAVKISREGSIESGGTAPTATCNGNTATIESGSSPVMTRLTAPATPGTSCVVTLATGAFTNKAHCDATNETAVGGRVVPMVCSSATSCTITDALLAASDVLSFHCWGHF